MNEEQTSAIHNMERASKAVQAQPTMAQGARATETRYGEAYQGLVVAGLAPQLKQKYRP